MAIRRRATAGRSRMAIRHVARTTRRRRRRAAMGIRTARLAVPLTVPREAATKTPNGAMAFCHEMVRCQATEAQTERPPPESGGGTGLLPRRRSRRLHQPRATPAPNLLPGPLRRLQWSTSDDRRRGNWGELSRRGREEDLRSPGGGRDGSSNITDEASGRGQRRWI